MNNWPKTWIKWKNQKIKSLSDFLKKSVFYWCSSIQSHSTRPTVTYWLCHPFLSVTMMWIGPVPVLSHFDHRCHSPFATHICQDPFHQCNFTEFALGEGEKKKITPLLQHLCNLMQSRGRAPQHQICSKTLFCFCSSCTRSMTSVLKI